MNLDRIPIPPVPAAAPVPRLVVLLLFLFSPSVHAAPAEILPPGRTVSIRDCVEIALRNNIDIAISRTRMEIGALGVPVEEAAFLPKFTGEASGSRSLTPSESILDNSAATEQRLFKLDLGVSDLLRTGTSISLAFENQRQETNSSVAVLSPQYSTALTFTARQPLLKNLGRKVTEAPLRIARAGAAEKTEEWIGRVMEIVAAARSAFLSYSAAAEEVRVRRTAVELSERLLASTDAGIKAGSAAPMDRLPAEAAAASRREELLRAEAAARSAEGDLKGVLGLRSAREWDEPFVPDPLPEDLSPPGDEETVEEALRRRPEVAALRARKTQAEIHEMVAGNQKLPTLDFTVTGGLSGLAGSPNPNPLFPANPTAFSGNYQDSVDQMLSGRYRNVFLGLKTEIPWRFDRERAEWEKSRAALREQLLQEEALLLRIRLEVRKGRLDLESALARIPATRIARLAAEKKLEAEERKLSLGRSTAVEVLRFQQDVSEARLAELRARIDSWRYRTNLWRAVGNILEKEGIQLK